MAFCFGLTLNTKKLKTMKSLRYMLSAAALMIVTSAFSQYALQTGKMQVNAGVGANFGAATPIYVGADYGYDKDISFGGVVSLWSGNRGLGISANANYLHLCFCMGL
jgi:hypothetical protein